MPLVIHVSKANKWIWKSIYMYKTELEANMELIVVVVNSYIFSSF